MEKIEERIKEELEECFKVEQIQNFRYQTIDKIINGKNSIHMLFSEQERFITFVLTARLTKKKVLVITQNMEQNQKFVHQMTDKKVKTFVIDGQHHSCKEMLTDDVEIIYVLPHLLAEKDIFTFLKKEEFSAIMIDDAHKISRLSFQFDPQYLAIVDFIKSNNNKSVVALLTGALSKKVKEDMTVIYDLKQYEYSYPILMEEELKIEIKELDEQQKEQIVCQLLKKHQQGIIYTISSKIADRLYQKLLNLEYEVSIYHHDLSEREKKANLTSFLDGKTHYIITTFPYVQELITPNIDCCIWYNVMSNLELLYEKIALIKKNQQKLDVIILFDPSEIAMNRYLIEQEPTYINKTNAIENLKEVIQFLNTDQCLRRYLFDYFGIYSHTFYCQCCSNCNSENKLIDITIDAQKILSCIKRIENRFSINMFVDILRGAKMAPVGSIDFTELSTYGIMKNYSKDTVKELIKLLIAEGYIISKSKGYPVLLLTNKALEVLFYQEKVLVNKIKLKNISLKDIKSNQNYDKELFQILRKVRHHFATLYGIPPFIILLDTSIIDMCRYYPLTKEELLKVPGFSHMKYEQYGEEFIEKIREYLDSKSEYLGKSKQSILPVMDTYNTTYVMYKGGKDISTIAKKRKMKKENIEEHLLVCFEKGYEVNVDDFINHQYEAQILEAIRKYGRKNFPLIKKHVPNDARDIDIKYYLLKSKEMKF